MPDSLSPKESRPAHRSRGPLSCSRCRLRSRRTHPRQHHGLHRFRAGAPKLGTANMIVPLGRQYLELIAIADPQEAATEPSRQACDRRWRTGGCSSTGPSGRAASIRCGPSWSAAAGSCRHPGKASRRRPDGQSCAGARRCRHRAAWIPSRLPSSGTSPTASTLVRRAAQHRAVRPPFAAVVAARQPGHVREQLQLSGDSDLYRGPHGRLGRVSGAGARSPHGDLVVDATLGG